MSTGTGAFKKVGGHQKLLIELGIGLAEMRPENAEVFNVD
jgi:hypothetical protein